MTNLKKRDLEKIISDVIANPNKEKSVDLKKKNQGIRQEDEVEESSKVGNTVNVNDKRGRILLDKKTGNPYCPYSYEAEENIFPKAIRHKGAIIKIAGGGYENYEGFIYAWNDYLIARKKSDGEWYCRRCSSIAKEEHNKKCFINNDYHICREECTLSKIYCQNCKTKIDF